METTVRRERVKENTHVLRRVDSGNDQVKTPGKLFEFAVSLRVVDIMSAELSCFGFLAVTGRKRMHFTTPFVRKLQRHVPQSTDANDSNASGGRHIMKQ